jgi:hypothetical protein
LRHSVLGNIRSSRGIVQAAERRGWTIRVARVCDCEPSAASAERHILLRFARNVWRVYAKLLERAHDQDRYLVPEHMRELGSIRRCFAR